MKKVTLSLLVSLFVLILNAQTEKSTSPLTDFVGKYLFPDGSPVPSVEVILTDTMLIMTSDQATSTLVKLGVDSFSIVEFSGTAVFKRSEEKKVKGVHIEAAGYILEGEKIPEAGWSFKLFLHPDQTEMMAIRNDQNL